MKYKTIVSYSVIRFMPYPELGEFVNVGIVALDHDSCEFDYILNANHRGRVNSFFEELEKDYFTKIVHGTVKTLQALKKSELNGFQLYKTDAMKLFRNFTAPIESIVYYDTPQVQLFKCGFKEAIQSLHKNLILRQEKKSKTYQEGEMAKRLKSSLSSHERLKSKLLYDVKLGDESGVYLPVTCTTVEKKRGIRVLNLNKTEPNQIISSAAKILETIDMLRDTIDFDDVLMAISPPKKKSEKFQQAYLHMMKKFEAEEKIQHCNFSEKENIISYALSI